MKIEFEGFDELQKKLKGLTHRIESISGENYVPLVELLNPAFLKKHTKYSNIDVFFKAGGFKVESKEDFEKIPDDKLDTFISKNTKFKNWEEMISIAGTDWIKRKTEL